MCNLCDAADLLAALRSGRGGLVDGPALRDAMERLAAAQAAPACPAAARSADRPAPPALAPRATLPSPRG
ncbi:hypothetical protein FDP22_11900 [Paroceanicella profunda]|uniref:Uncharacterized protein n=1 Tax=Paroceanicella profunda TaxID=2579971 RepID=A0A5B8G056_9RHOB|nr:hypothetical protein [Paroceanicella profunda]QDL92419.1 hypothetical protein FDP22_11900 [Paroceanicella profunda]